MGPKKKKRRSLCFHVDPVQVDNQPYSEGLKLSGFSSFNLLSVALPNPKKSFKKNIQFLPLTTEVESKHFKTGSSVFFLSAHLKPGC